MLYLIYLDYVGRHIKQILTIVSWINGILIFLKINFFFLILKVKIELNNF